MSDAQAKSDRGKSDDLPVSRSAQPAARNLPKVRIRIIPLLITLATTALAGVLGWAMWEAYMGAPWTRDATVRTYVVTKAPEVAGRVVELPVIDDQFVHEGDLLLVIDPTDYKIAVELAGAAVRQAQANVENFEAQITVQQAQVSASQAQVRRASPSSGLPHLTRMAVSPPPRLHRGAALGAVIPDSWPATCVSVFADTGGVGSQASPGSTMNW